MLVAATRLPAQEALHLRLNLPAFRMDVLEGATRWYSYSVSIGMKKFRTPTGEFAMSRLEWNPWWFPPDEAWARKEKITPPGPDNPMGRVKLHLRDVYYVHGTPFEMSIGTAASHGCIRMKNEDVIALARVVQRYTGAQITESATDSLATMLYESRVVQLPRPVRVAVVYELAEVRDGILDVYPDIYSGRHGSPRMHVLAALARGGYDTTLVDAKEVGRVLKRAKRVPRAVLVSAILKIPQMQRAPAVE